MNYFRILLSIGFLSIGAALSGQALTAGYFKMYAIADSMDRIDSIHKIDPIAFKIADSLSATHPSSYFHSATSLMSDGKYDEAAFVFYVGRYRYRYYNSINPNYKPGEDGALLASFGYTLGEPIGLYLMTNVANYISVLTQVKSYLEKNDYAFAPKGKDTAKFDKQITTISNTIADLQTNRATYSEQWKTDRANLIEGLLEYEKNYVPDYSIPASDEPIVVRTDLRDGVLWQKIILEMISPDEFGFTAKVAFIEKPDLSKIPVQSIATDTGSKYQWSFIFIADSLTMVHPEHPLLCVGLKSNSGKTFRFVPSAMAGIENNLSISNMDFEDFMYATEPDGIFRGFKKGK